MKKNTDSGCNGKFYLIFAIYNNPGKMKRSGLLLLMVFGLLQLQGQVARTLLIESFTNPCCTPCGSQQAWLDSLMQQYSGKIVYLQYQTNWPCTASNPDPSIQERAAFYQLKTLPWTALNGKPAEGKHFNGAPLNITPALLAQEMKTTSPLQLSLTHYIELDKDSLVMTLVIKVMDNVKGDFLVQFAVQEKEIVSSIPENGVEAVRQNNICHAILNGTEETRLPSELKSGEIYVISRKWKIQGITDPLQLCASAWVSQKSGKIPVQAAFSEPVGPDYHDAELHAILKPGKMICGSELEPVVVFRNLGGKNLKSLEILYSINNGPVQRYNWTGDLPFLAKQEIKLPLVPFTVLPSSNELTVQIQEPNQSNDFKPENNTLSCRFNASPKSGIPLQIEILTDQYPGETSWKIKNSSGQIVFHGGNYNNANTLYQENLNFSTSDCYTFIIQDAGKDGLSGKYGKGHYSLRNQHGQLMAGGDRFTAEDLVPFEIDTKLEVPDLEVTSDFTVFPNPFDNSATLSIHISKTMSVKIRVSNEMGQVLYSQDNDDLPAGNHIYELNGDNWSPGIYVVKVLTGDKLITKKLTLSK